MIPKKKQTIWVFTVIFICLTFNLSTSAQNFINYQAIIRDNDGNPVNQKPIQATFSILHKNETGSPVWKEEQNTTSSNLGLVTFRIGTSKNLVTNNIDSLHHINWGNGPYYLKVEIGIDRESKIHFGTTQIVSVPYALYASRAGVATPDFSKFTFDATSNTLKNDGTILANLSSLSQNLEYDAANYHLSISGKPGIVDLRQFAHSPQDLRTLNNKLWITGNKDSTVVDLSPYKQTLQISSTSKLQISGGNEVQVDTSNVNEIQKISRSESKIILSRNGGEVSVDTSNINEIQTLSLNGNKIALSKSGGEVTVDASETNELQTLSKVNGALVLSNAPNGRAIPIDTSNVNELQDLTLTGNTLKITGNTSATNIDLSKYLDDTDKQTLSRTGNNLEISGGNNIDVSDMINMTWSGFSSNNLAGQPLPGGSAETLITWNEEFDFGSILDNNAFIAPVSGVFSLSFTLVFQGTLIVKVYKDNGGTNTSIRSFEGFGQSISHSMLLNLQAGEKVTIKATNTSGITAYVATGYFSGFRVK